jgi:hypothetical protein
MNRPVRDNETGWSRGVVLIFEGTVATLGQHLAVFSQCPLMVPLQAPVS